MMERELLKKLGEFRGLPHESEWLEFKCRGWTTLALGVGFKRKSENLDANIVV